MTIEPKFVSSSAGSAQGSLTIGETATYSATFIISSQAFLNALECDSVSAFGGIVAFNSKVDIAVSYTHLRAHET